MKTNQNNKSIGEYQEKLSPIMYKGKEIDRGWILGRRKYRWALKRQYEPCWAKNGHFISQLSPHKKDFYVYIPADEIKGTFTIVNRTVRIEITVIEVNAAYVRFSVDHIHDHKRCSLPKSEVTNETVPF